VVVTYPVLITEPVAVGEANTSNIEHRESEEKTICSQSLSAYNMVKCKHQQGHKGMFLTPEVLEKEMSLKI